MKAKLVIERVGPYGQVSGWCDTDPPIEYGTLTIEIRKQGETIHQFSTGRARPDLSENQGFITTLPATLTAGDLRTENVQITLAAVPDCQISVYVLEDYEGLAVPNQYDDPSAADHTGEVLGADVQTTPGGGHAVLVLAHSQPKVLAQALPIYTRLGWDVYIHLDSKVNLEHYQAQLGPLDHNVQFASERHEIFWAGYSMIEATLTLISDTKKSGIPYTRVSLLSDDTMPLWHDEQLAQWAASARDWIELRLQPPGDLGWQRYYGFYYWDHPTTARRRIHHQVEIDDQMIDAIRDLGALKQIGKKQIDVYKGSQWWSMTNETLERVLALVTGDPHLQASFRFSEVPDELYFQTLVVMSGFDRVLNRGPCFADWNGPPYPRTFERVSELPAEAQHHPFARKFVVNAGGRE